MYTVVPRVMAVKSLGAPGAWQPPVTGTTTSFEGALSPTPLFTPFTRT